MQSQKPAGMPSQPGGTAKGPGKEEIVASHGALSVVAGWLGISAEAALEDLGPGANDNDQQVKRAPFQGLGAKFIRHHQGVAFAAALDSRLQKRLEAGRKRRAADEDEEEQATGKAAKTGNGGPAQAGPNKQHQRGFGGKAGAQASRAQQPVSDNAAGDSDDDDDDEEGGGRARQLGRSRLAQAPLAAPPAQPQQQQQQQHKPAAQQQGGSGAGPAAPAAAAAAAVPLSAKAQRERWLLALPEAEAQAQAKKQKKKKKNKQPQAQAQQ